MRMVLGDVKDENPTARDTKEPPEVCPNCGSTDIRFHPCLGEDYHRGGWICFDCEKLIQEGGIPEDAIFED